MNRVGDKLQPCLNPLVSLKPFVIRFPIFIFELDPLHDFIASINLVLIVDLSRVSHNLFNGTLSYAFFKSINNRRNSLLVAFFFFYNLCYAKKMLSIHEFQLENLIGLPSPYSYILTLPILLVCVHKFC